VRFASHGSTHRPLVGLSTEELLWEGVRARSVLARELGEPVIALAYPYGDHDAVVRRLAAACGYECALTCDFDRSRLTDDPMALPRLEVAGTDDLAAFAEKIGAA
jgi:peptidoglycan/xylan/chitin deacetylase (PgdA/CDA1 family)